MNIRIESGNGRYTVYTPRELRREVQSLARVFKFKMRDITEAYIYAPTMDASGSVSLRVYHRQPNGLIACSQVAL